MSLQQYNDIFSEPFNKQLLISVEGTNVVLTNEDICEESMLLEDSICSEKNLRFGACEAKCFKIRIVNNNIVFKDKWLTVALLCDLPDVLVDSDGNHIVNHDDEEIALASNESTSIALGRFKVFSDEPSNDRSWRDLTCYDEMNVILNTDVASWYSTLTFPMTIKNLRDYFFTYLGITQETVTLANDTFLTQGGFVAEGELSGKVIIEAICELNGVFGHMKANGKFGYIDITATESVTLSYYEDGTGKYSDYVIDAITGVLARGSEDDVGTSVGTTTNEYVIENNPLVFGSEGTQALTTALTNLLNKISTVSFRPFAVSTYGNPMLTAGSGVTIVTRDITINSIVISKTMNGIQALRDNLEATSDKSQPSMVNNVQSQISRTQGKVHNLRIDVDELSSEMISVQSINKKAIKVYACSSYSSDLQDARIRLNVPITDGSFETLGNSESTKIGITLPSDFSVYDTNERDLKIIIGSTELIAPIYYDGSALTNQIAAKGGDIMYFNLSTDASGNYSADVIMDTTSRSLISQTAEGIELMVEQVNGVNIPVYEMTSYNYDSVNDVVTIYAEDLPFDSLLALYDIPHRVGIKLKPMTATQKAAKKEVWLYASGDNGNYISVTGWVYDSNNNIVTDAFDGDNIIYLEYDERTISGSDTFGFWVVTDTYSQSQIAMTNNQIVMKVDSNGNLVEVALGASASTGSIFKVNADNISFIANNKIELTANSLEINSNNFSVDTNGNVISKSFTVVPSATQHGAFKIKDVEDNVLGSWGGNYRYEGIAYHQLTPTRKDAYYSISKADFFAQNVFSDGSGDVTGGFTTHMKWDHNGLELQLLADPFAVNEADRTALLQFVGNERGALDIWNYGLDGWGTGTVSLRQSIQDMVDLVKVVSFSIANSDMTQGTQLGSHVSLDSGYKFLCWLQPVSEGWVTTFPIYC
ncbi:MAG: hypothetical protein J6S67_09255, partial [Methanobrevibacter sp.]|nr:hypothetical protein [Methanobrevibacter sp.]